jgi:hypothetical protein
MHAKDRADCLCVQGREYKSVSCWSAANNGGRGMLAKIRAECVCVQGWEYKRVGVSVCILQIALISHVPHRCLMLSQKQEHFTVNCRAGTYFMRWSGFNVVPSFELSRTGILKTPYFLRSLRKSYPSHFCLLQLKFFHHSTKCYEHLCIKSELPHH